MYQEIFLKASKLKNLHPELRFGQCLMNILFETDKNLYSEITCTEADCFYDDNKIEIFYKFIEGVE